MSLIKTCVEALYKFKKTSYGRLEDRLYEGVLNPFHTDTDWIRSDFWRHHSLAFVLEKKYSDNLKFNSACVLQHTGRCLSDQGRFPVTWCWTSLPLAEWHKKEITSSQYFRKRRQEFTAAESRHLSQLFPIHLSREAGRTWNSSAPPC